MPYIKREDRKKYDRLVDELVNELSQCDKLPVGHINYIITTMLDKAISKHGLCYDNINAMMGVLSCISTELYRRVAVPYENKKIEQNGDVFTENNK